MRNASWKIEFPDIYKQIRLHYPPELANESSLIFLACKENLISSNTYLDWAYRYYAIALIVDQFFTQNFDRTVYDKYADLANWSEEFYPIYQWDGVVFVACMDPYILAKLQLKIAIRPLLASYENLVKGWHLINNPTAVTHQDTTLHEDFESIEFNVEGDDLLKLSDEAEEDDLLKLSDESEDETSSSAEDNLDLLDNLEPIEQLDLLDNLEPHKDLPKSKDYSYRNDLPNDNEQTQIPEGLFDENDETIAPPIRRTQALPSVPPKPPVPPAPLVPPPPSAPPMLAKKLEKKIAPQFPLNFPQIPDDATNVIPSAAPMAVQSVISNETPVSLENNALSKTDKPIINRGLLPTIKETLNHAYKYYNRLMILAINPNETLTPVYWDQNFKQKNSTQVIPLYQPSPFRIAYKTAKPFHGLVSMNQILENFVKEWLNDHPINVLTIVPLVDNNSSFALLLGIADNDIDLKDSLNHFVQVAQDTTKQITNSAHTKVA